MKRKSLFYLFLLFFSMQILNAQEKIISGMVVSATDGSSIPGVSVIAKGINIGTITDNEGLYRFEVPGNVNTIVFSFIGMKTLEMEIVGEVLNAELEQDMIGVEEVLVVAYGTATKGSFTGSATKIKSEKIELRPITSVTNAIEGSSPGVMSSAGSGQPGSSQDIRIRGFGSYSASSDPLYVVDGVPYSGSISSINSNDIESLTVLKDAASASLYGNKAANGVVLITTKKGKSGEGQLSLNASFGLVTRSQPEYDRINAFDYYPVMWEAYRNSLAIPGVDSEDDVANANLEASQEIYYELGYNPFNVSNDNIVGVDGKINPNAHYLGKYGEDLDWLGAVMRTGQRQNYDIDYQGATQKADYYVSLGYLNEEGYIINSDYQRFSGRANVNYKATEWLKTGLNLSGSTTKSNFAQTTNSNAFVNPIRFTRGIGSIYPIHAIDPQTGEYILNDLGEKIFDLNDNRAGGASPGRHIVAETLWNEDNDETSTIGAKTYAQIKLYTDLTFTMNASFDQRNYYNTTFKNKIIGDGAPGGRAYRTNSRRTSVNFNQILNYDKRFNKNNIKALIAHESYNYKYNYLYGARAEQIADNNSELVNYVTTTDLTSYTDEYATESYFGQVNYDFDNKYFLSASYRTDGSSKFAKENRWGNFWSVGTAWRVDQEEFMKNANFVNLLKLRGSYGETGNDAGIDYYAYQALYSLDYNNQYEMGIVQDKLEARSLVWESSNSFDVAVEYGLIDRLSGTVEFYHRISDNLLFEVPLPLSSGLTSLNDNVGTMFNQGLEFNISYDAIKKQNFNWNINVNLSTLKNEFTKLPGDEPDTPAEIITDDHKLMVGHSIYDYWLSEWYGVDPVDGAALYMAEDLTASSVRIMGKDTVTTDINNARYGYVGTAIPDVFGSVSNRFSYKNFELSFMFTYSLGGEILDYNYQSVMSSGRYGAGLSTDILSRWQNPGDVTEVPRMDAAETSNFNATSSRWLTDASYLNLRNLNLVYNLPPGIFGKSGISGARIYLSGENLWLLNARKGMNIQQNFGGTTSNFYTPSRIISLGANIKF